MKVTTFQWSPPHVEGKDTLYLHLKLRIVNGTMYYTCVHNRQGGGGAKFVQDLLKIQFNGQFHKFFLFLFS